MVAAAQEFVHNFFDANPLCQLCVTSSCSDAVGGEPGTKTTGPRPGVPATVSALSGDPRLHERGLGGVAVGRGQFSLQRCVEHAVEVLDTVPAGAVRELLFLMASTSTFDERDIAATLMGLEKNVRPRGLPPSRGAPASLGAQQYRCSVVSVSCEVHVMRQMTQLTGGSHAVATSPTHLRRLMEAHVTPPPLRAGEAAAKPTMQVMGFPKLKVEPGVCACHLELRARGYECPRCGGRVCNLPGDCAVCRLRLADPSHLARSYHHLMPAALYKPVPRTALDPDASCLACGAALAGRRAGMSVEALRCEGCAHLFCDACDAFVHEILHNCPGCLGGGVGGGGAGSGERERGGGDGAAEKGAPSVSDGVQNGAAAAAAAQHGVQKGLKQEPAL